MNTWLKLFNKKASNSVVLAHTNQTLKAEASAQESEAIAIAKREVFIDKDKKVIMDKEHPLYNYLSAMISYFEHWRHNCDFEKQQLLKIKCTIVFDDLYKSVMDFGDKKSAKAMINLINQYDDIIYGYNETINEFLLPSSNIDRHLSNMPSLR